MWQIIHLLPTYEHTVQVLEGTEDLQDVLRWRVAMDSLFIGLNANTYATRNPLAQRMLKGSALTAYNQYSNNRYLQSVQTARQTHNDAVRAYQNEQQVITDMTNLRNEWDAADAAHTANATAPAPVGPQPPNAPAPTLADPGVFDPTTIAHEVIEVSQGIAGVIMYMTPTKGLQKVKRYLRRKCRKPEGMKAREFFNNFSRINNDEIPLLPPRYNRAQSLTNDEVIDILLFAFPKSWQGEMERQGYDPLLGTVNELITFCERLENAEDLDKKPSANTKSDNKKTDTSKKAKSSGHKEKTCLLHGKGSHDTNECKTLQTQVTKMKENNPDGKSYKNNTWSRKKEEDQKKAKKDLAAMVKKTIRKEVNALSKKRKSSDDDSEQEEINNIDLSSFNYTDLDTTTTQMDNMSIASSKDGLLSETHDTDDDMEFDDDVSC